MSSGNEEEDEPTQTNKKSKSNVTTSKKGVESKTSEMKQVIAKATDEDAAEAMRLHTFTEVGMRMQRLFDAGLAFSVAIGSVDSTSITDIMLVATNIQAESE
jgi:hypothetical protein